MDTLTNAALPGANLDTARMPGHWLLARLGKRVLRPGGLELTQKMLRALAIKPNDDVVEFAPGLGVTTRLVLDAKPASFTAVERDANAAAYIATLLQGPTQRCVTGRAEDTTLETESASVVFGEAMLSMQSPKGKRKIVREAARILRPGGRYGIHELGLAPDDLADEVKQQIEADLSESIHVGARPLTPSEWSSMLERSGFRVLHLETNEMHLLEPARIIADEGVSGALKIAFNVARDSAARRRVHSMRRCFHRWQDHLCAITIVAEYVGRQPRAEA